MNIIIPMAGAGKRMRPHTLTTPKPLLPVAGKSIVQRLVEGLARMCDEKINEIAFVIGDFGEKVESDLIEIAKNQGAKGKIFYQHEALGTAHAVLCAAEALKGKVIVAFADTLFYADFKLEENKDGIIWVEKVEDPRPFGVVKLDKNGVISEFVEKPQTFVSDLAIIGIYYFKNGESLHDELKYLIDNDVKDKGEYQLTSALENMKGKGLRFYAGQVEEWLDCGNKNATVYTNKRVLEREGSVISQDINLENSVIVDPCFIGEKVILKNSIIGPYVSIGNESKIENSVIQNSIIQEKAHIENQVLGNSMIGNNTVYLGKVKEASLGDYNQLS